MLGPRELVRRAERRGRGRYRWGRLRGGWRPRRGGPTASRSYPRQQLPGKRGARGPRAFPSLLPPPKKPPKQQKKGKVQRDFSARRVIPTSPGIFCVPRRFEAAAPRPGAPAGRPGRRHPGNFTLGEMLRNGFSLKRGGSGGDGRGAGCSQTFLSGEERCGGGDGATRGSQKEHASPPSTRCCPTTPSRLHRPLCSWYA